MKFFLLILLLLTLCPFFTRAQSSKVDELNKRLFKAVTVNDKIDFYNQISSEIRITNADSAMSLANKALDLSIKNNYTYGEGTAYLCIALANIVKGKYEISYDNAVKATAIAENTGSDSLLAYSNAAVASYYFNKGNYDKSIEKALFAVKIFDKINNPVGLLKANNIMAQVYQLKNDIPHAEKILKENLALFHKIDDSKIKVSTLHTLANVYGMQGKFAEALELDRQGLILCDAEKLDFLKSQLFDNMANCYMYSNRFTQAKEYFIKCLVIDSSFNNKKQMADTYLNLGNLFLMQKKYAEAKDNLFHSISLSDSTGYKQGKYGAYQLLSELYKTTNESDKAFTALQNAYSVKDSMINESTENKIAELETIYQSEKKEQQLKLQKAEIEKKNFLLWGSAAGLILLLVSGFSFYRKRQLQNEIHLQAEVMKQQDIATKGIITAEENERKRIAADLHDGVGQLMSAAKMNLSAFENEIQFNNESQRISFEKVIGLVDESCKEIRSVSHQMMPNALLKSGLASAVKEFLDKLDNRVLKVNLHTEGLNERLDSNVETVLYRVIQECVNNVIKHAGANMLDISLIKDSDGIAATIEDNGKGFDTKDKLKFEGIGLKNIASRIGYLKGTVDFDSNPGNGTLVAIHVPIA